MLENLKQFYKKSLEDGFKSSMVSGEMHWTLETIRGTEKAIMIFSLKNKPFFRENNLKILKTKKLLVTKELINIKNGVKTLLTKKIAIKDKRY